MIEPPVLGNRYELKTILGSGGMGRVWRAWDASLRREVAVKTMGEGFADDYSWRLRFEREAQHAASLNHPNIVQVHDYGIHGSTPYIIMELVTGLTLDGLISGHRLLDPHSTVQIAGHVLGALDHAHSKSIIHRDMKPQNIVIADEGTVKVTDFGLAKSVTDTDLTLAGNVIGTPTYISPEQASDDPLTPRSDLYSVGCVLYQCLAGRPPFVGVSKTEVVSMHVNDVVPPLRALRPDLSRALEAPIMQSLAKDPSERFESAHQMSLALQTALMSEAAPSADPAPAAANVTPVVLTRVLNEGSSTDVQLAAPPAVTKVIRPRRRRRRLGPRLAGTGLLAALLVVAIARLVQDGPGSISGDGRNDRRQSGVQLANFEGRSFSIKYPSGWKITRADEDEQGLVATEIESPRDPSALMKIHIVTQGQRDAEDLLEQNRRALNDDPRYRELGVRRFEFTHSDGRSYPAIRWEFQVWDGERSVLLRKTDVFFSSPDGDGIALLTQASDARFPRWAPLFERIRKSIALVGKQVFPEAGFGHFQEDLLSFDYPAGPSSPCGRNSSSECGAPSP